MPRPNQTRQVFAESHLASRVASERESRGWSMEGLAKRMTDAGCSMSGSAIYKIERADPPRRITVDELVALSRVLGIPVEELLLPPEVAASQELTRLMLRWDEAQTQLFMADQAEAEAWRTVVAYVEQRDEFAGVAEQVVAKWAAGKTDDDAQRAALTASRMARLTDTPEWHARAWEAMTIANDNRKVRRDGQHQEAT